MSSAKWQHFCLGLNGLRGADWGPADLSIKPHNDHASALTHDVLYTLPNHLNKHLFDQSTL